MRRLPLLLFLFVFVLPGCGDDNPAPPPPPPPPAITGEMILISAGSFTMGSAEDEIGYLGDEAQHPVTLTNDFSMFSTEVTNQQYADLAQWALDNGYCTVEGPRVYDNLDGSDLWLLDMDDDEDCEISYLGSQFVVDAGLENHPVVEVLWHGAAAYCDWLSLKEGLPRAYDHTDPNSWLCNDGAPYAAQGYRLPTEAEWEYACRAGSAAAFAAGPITEIACGDEPSLLEMGWYCGNADGWTHPVATLEANAFGLFDLHGNVWEWCNDWYHNQYADEEVDPIGPPPGWYKVLRGGGWSDLSRRCRSASRRNPSPHKGVNGRHGFRYVITAP
ncbi:MAG: SUMF1/EgtB/PvdO family nonheme iron enzyme [Candidatus Krumholzibacteria bacterium]|nr:SUMF1/EgtB/PvdO family nonheme iron enzyme [Candidatus Krumholzibacteria bacterium]